MVWTTFDLSDITDSLVTRLNNAVTASPMWVSNGGLIPNFTISVTGNSPDATRDSKDADCQLNLYLLHVGQDPFLRNTPLLGTSAMQNTQQPLSLNLSYLLTAYATENAAREQQAMSIALRNFHEQPSYTDGAEYLTINLGTDALPEMSGLWQSFACAYRLSTIYRVAVALLTPTVAPGKPFKPPSQVGLAVAPATDLTVTPQLYAMARKTGLAAPAGDTDPDQVALTPGAVIAAGGDQLVIGGQGLATAQASDIYLTTLDGATTWTVTSWRVGPVLDPELVLQLPAAYFIGAAAAPPASTPPPGAYLLSVGQAGPPPRRAAIPLAIAPRFANVLSPPILPGGPDYSIAGAGFSPTATQLFLGSDPIPPAQVTITPAGDKITFTLPAGQPPGRVPVRVRVDGVDAPTTWSLVAP